MLRIVVAGVALSVALGVAGCGTHPHPRTVAEFKDDPLVLQGVIARCAADKVAAATDVECANAHVANEQLGELHDRARSQERNLQFDRLREQRRQRDEQQRQVAESSRFDPYSSPVAPAEPKGAEEQH